jgi:diguanylate cyclase (GGDEF) domain
MLLLQNILLITSCFLLTVMAINTGLKLKVVGMPALFAMILFFMVWVIGNIAEVNSSDFQWMLWSRNIQQIGVFFAPLSCLYFSISYTANKKIAVIVYPITAVQITSVFLIFTDGYFHLMRKSVELQTDTVFGKSIVVDPTGLGSLLVAFNFCIPLIALAILALYLKSVSDKLRRPLWLIIISIFMTFSIAVLQSTVFYNLGIDIPIPVLNLPCVMLMTYAVLSSGFFGITPTALNKVFDVIDQGIIVIDENGYVIEYNKRALELLSEFGGFEKIKIGAPIITLIPGVTADTRNLTFSADELPSELPKSNSGRYLSLAHHTLGKTSGKLIGFVCVLTDITLLKERAEIDPMTGAYNRDGIAAAYEELHKAPINAAASAMIIDLDNFKSINDTYGHLGGDFVIKDFVSAAQAFLPEAYALGRLGGDEFVVLIPASAESAAETAEKLRACISERTVQYLEHKIRYTVSIGVAGMSIKNVTLNEFLHEADLALYKAKQCGKNLVSV